MMTSTENVQNELICPICADYFTSPKGLPCLHTFCRDCLKAHIISQNHKRQFSCPMCRLSVPTPEDKPRSEWVDMFPTNHHVVSIMDIVIPNFKPTFCKLCTEGGKQHKAVKTCEVCVEDYCENCARMHTLLNATKQHSLSELVHVKKHHTQSISVSSTNTEPKVEYKINATCKGTINAKTDQDDEPSFITGVIFLEDDRIVAVDNSNYKIKLFGCEGKYLTEVCQVRPFGLSWIHQTDIAVTEDDCITFFQIHPNKIKLQKTYNVEWKIYTPHTIRVSNATRGLHYRNGEFVVCSGDDIDKHVVIVDTYGNNKRHIWKNECARGNAFRDPWYCKFDDDLGDIYVSDGVGVSGNVKCLTYHGKPKWEYPCQMPRGIDIIGEHIFVADWRDDEIKVTMQ